MDTAAPASASRLAATRPSPPLLPEPHKITSLASDTVVTRARMCSAAACPAESIIMANDNPVLSAAASIAFISLMVTILIDIPTPAMILSILGSRVFATDQYCRCAGRSAHLAPQQAEGAIPLQCLAGAFVKRGRHKPQLSARLGAGHFPVVEDIRGQVERVIGLAPGPRGAPAKPAGQRQHGPGRNVEAPGGDAGQPADDLVDLAVADRIARERIHLAGPASFQRRDDDASDIGHEHGEGEPAAPVHLDEQTTQWILEEQPVEGIAPPGAIKCARAQDDGWQARILLKHAHKVLAIHLAALIGIHRTAYGGLVNHLPRLRVAGHGHGGYVHQLLNPMAQRGF